MKRFIEKFNDYRYKKRLRKWAIINILLVFRKTKRFLNSKKFRSAVTSISAIMLYISVFLLLALSFSSVYFTKYVCPNFDTESKIINRLAMTKFDDSVPYLKSLHALGSSNRIQVTLNTDKENYVNPKGVGLDRGSVNIKLTFSDGETTEFALNNSRYDNFESGMVDNFTLILPFGYTPFDITEYSIVVLPDINNKYDSWHCKWARVYFMLGNEPVMLAKEAWDSTAVFGSGENMVKQSILEIAHTTNNRYNRTNQVYSYYLELSQKGASQLINADLKADTLDLLGLNAGKYLYIDVETANIEMQNNFFTYYTKGVQIVETDSLDYDGRLFLDVTFFSEKPGGGYTESFMLDTLGTDDFELGTTSSFQLELPEGMCAFDISDIRLRVENPYDAWAPHYIRVYIKPDYSDRLEIARLTDTILVNGYSTPIFFKNLIDTSVPLDLSTKFSISTTVKDKIESENQFKFGDKISDMYFTLQNFYERQSMFLAQMVVLYTPGVYEPVTEPVADTQPDDDTAVPETDVPTGTSDDTPEIKEPENTPVTQPEGTPADQTQENTPAEQTQQPQPDEEQTPQDTPESEQEQTGDGENSHSSVWVPGSDEQTTTEPTHSTWTTQQNTGE